MILRRIIPQNSIIISNYVDDYLLRAGTSFRIMSNSYFVSLNKSEKDKVIKQGAYFFPGMFLKNPFFRPDNKDIERQRELLKESKLHLVKKIFNEFPIYRIVGLKE